MNFFLSLVGTFAAGIGLYLLIGSIIEVLCLVLFVGLVLAILAGSEGAD